MDIVGWGWEHLNLLGTPLEVRAVCGGEGRGQGQFMAVKEEEENGLPTLEWARTERETMLRVKGS